MNLTRILSVVLCLLMVGVGSFARAETHITGVSVEPIRGGERLVLQSDGPLQPRSVLTLANPSRVVLDFQSVKSNSLRLPVGYSGVIRGVRFGQFDPITSRVVLDVGAAVGKPVTRSERGSNGWRYTVEMQTAGVPQTPVVNTPPPEPTKDEKPLIVIDAGHGGQDPGTSGVRGTREKHVTLDLAKQLRQSLLRTGRYRVALTRDNDTFIMLGERVNIARRLKADMFISLHADSNPRKDARGMSIYTISETASDAETAALAARENAVDELSGMDLGTVDRDVADILLDLATRETKAKSSQVADIILDAMHPKIRRVSRAHRYAGFRVLKAPDIPSVLIELGFLTNSDDEKLLMSKEYRALVTSSITKGVDAYYVMVKRR